MKKLIAMLIAWEAHIAHLVFHDVPAALYEQWAAEAETAPAQLTRLEVLAARPRTTNRHTDD
jgi:hypothetical protein